MKIKTTRQIRADSNLVTNDSRLDMNQFNKKWVAVDELVEELEDCQNTVTLNETDNKLSQLIKRLKGEGK